MFKDLMKSIFNEDIDIDEELEDEEEVEVEEQPKEESVKVEEKKEESPFVNLTVEPQVQQPVQQEVQPQPKVMNFEETFAQPVVNEPVKSKSFVDLTVDDVSGQESRPSKKKAYHYDRKKLQKSPVRRNNGQNVSQDYQAIISPIFGNTEDEKKDFTKVHDAIRLEKPLYDPNFNEVISPMYGNDLPKQKQVESIPTQNPGSEEVAASQAIELSDLLGKPEKQTEQPVDLFASKK